MLYNKAGEVHYNKSFETTETISYRGIRINYRLLKEQLTSQDNDALELSWSIMGGFTGDVSNAEFNEYSIIEENAKFKGHGILINTDYVNTYKTRYLNQLLEALELTNFVVKESKISKIDLLFYFFTNLKYGLFNTIGKTAQIYGSIKGYKTVRNRVFNENKNGDTIEYFPDEYSKIIDGLKKQYQLDKSEENQNKLLGKGMLAIEEMIKLNLCSLWVHEYAHGMEHEFSKGKSFKLSDFLLKLSGHMMKVSSFSFNFATFQLVSMTTLYKLAMNGNLILSETYNKLGSFGLDSTQFRLAMAVTTIGFMVGGSVLGYHTMKELKLAHEMIPVIYEKKVNEGKIKFRNVISIDHEDFWDFYQDGDDISIILRKGLEFIKIFEQKN